MWIRKLCPALLFLGSLVLFLCTLAPTVTFVDSGELIVTARNLGVAHPPGFPLYLLITHLATLLPFGNVAQRVHFASALFAALAVALVYLVTIEGILALRDPVVKKNAGKARPREKQIVPKERWACVAGLVSGGLAAFSRTLWSYATVAEVYTLNALLILLVFLLLLRWRNSVANAVSGSGERSGHRLLYSAAFVFGLALGVHHVTVALTLPALLWLVYTAKGMGFFKSRQMLAVAFSFLIGCAIYAYLPIAASRAPVMNWGNPDTLERVWNHISGRQYQTYFSLSADQMQRQVSSFLRVMFEEFGRPWLPAGLLLATVGLFSLWRRDWRLLVFFVLIITCNLLFSIGYEIAEDKDAYSLPIFLVIAIAAGFGAHAILASFEGRKTVIAAIIVLLAPINSFAANFRLNNRHNYYVAEDYVSNILSTMAPNGMLLTADWQVASPMLYAQEISQLRPDVICIDVQLLRRSWYYAYLESKHPILMRQAHDSVQLFVEDLLRWEKDPESYRKDRELTQRIDSRFCTMISTLVGKHLSGGPVYSTVDVVLNSSDENRTVANSLMERFQIVPQGLVFQLFADRETHPAQFPKLNLRGLIDREPVIDRDPVIRQKVIPVYAIMMVNCGRALSIQGDNAHAMDAYRQAWSMDAPLLIERNLLPEGVSFPRIP